MGQKLMTIILSNLKQFKKITERFLRKFVVKWVLKIPPHLAYVATLPGETLLSAKQAINDKLQGSVVTLTQHVYKMNIWLQCYDAVGWAAGRASGL